MKNILILGAGKSASVLIGYFLERAEENDWIVIVADADLQVAGQKIKGHKRGVAKGLNPENISSAIDLIRSSDIVISLLPAFLHPQIAKLCVDNKKNFVSASYVGDEMKQLDHAAKDANIILLNECGLDPGIDHMSAMELIHAIQEKGGEITAFESYTGGLIAPESDDNPWHYKFTWNPRNVVLAGQGTAKFLWNGNYKYIPYQQLFSRYDILEVEGFGEFEGYPNRDSLGYKNIYGLENASTLVRGTLRKRGFCDAWNIFVQLGITDDTYQIEGIAGFTWCDLLNSFLPLSDKPVKETLKNYLHVADDIMDKLEWLGIFSTEKINLMHATPAQALQHLLEKKWKLNHGDRDMCVMLHRIHYSLNNKKMGLQSELVVTGEDEIHTAMAKTVGLPAAIAAKMILDGKITAKGVVIPVIKEIYVPVLTELKNKFGISFSEKEIE